MKMRKIKSTVIPKILLLSVIVILLIAFILNTYLSAIPSQLTDSVTKTDAIVVLTGSAGRIDEGIMLIKEGLATELFISGVSPTTNLNDLVQLNDPALRKLSLPITLGAEAKNTRGNAIEIYNWVKNNNVSSIRLVTSAYHMPRSLREIRYIFSDTHIIPHPVFSEKIKMDWWIHPGTAGLLAIECTKYLTSSIRVFVMGWFKDNTHTSTIEKHP